MRNDHTPPGTISFLDLVEFIVERRHGSDAIAEVTISEGGEGGKNRIEVERAGKRIDYKTDSKRWDSAREAIRKACYNRKLVSYVRNKSGDELKISRIYWDAITEKTPAGDCHWYTFSHGLFQSTTEPSYNDRPLYFKKEDAIKFLDGMHGKTKKPGDKVKGDKQAFPPILEKWGQVRFCILDGGQFEIQAAGKNFSEKEVFGENPTDYLIKFLYQIIHKRGTFDNKSFNKIDKDNVRQYKERLNKLLKEKFKLNQDPITYNQQAGIYQSSFQCESELKYDPGSDTNSPESNTPLGVQTNKIRKSFKSDQ